MFSMRKKINYKESKVKIRDITLIVAVCAETWSRFYHKGITREIKKVSLWFWRGFPERLCPISLSRCPDDPSLLFVKKTLLEFHKQLETQERDRSSSNSVFVSGQYSILACSWQRGNRILQDYLVCSQTSEI